MRGSGGIPGVSSGGSQTSNQTASNPPAICVFVRLFVSEEGWYVSKMGIKKRYHKRQKGEREEEETLTAGNATTDNASHRYARIEKFGLLLWLYLDAGELAHLAHFTTNLLCIYANTRENSIPI